MTTSSPRIGRLTLALLGGVSFVITTPSIGHAREQPPASQPAGQIERHRRDMVRHMHAMGLSAESLAAAGASASDVSLVVERFCATCEALPTSLLGLESARRSAERIHASLVGRSLRSTWPTMQQDIASAAAAVADARRAEELTTNLVFNAAVAQLPEAIRGRITRHRANLDNRIPLHLSMTPRSDEATRTLAAALTAESNSPDRILSAEHQAALIAARTDEEALACAARLAANEAAIRAAFDAAVVTSLAQ